MLAGGVSANRGLDKSLNIFKSYISLAAKAIIIALSVQQLIGGSKSSTLSII